MRGFGVGSEESPESLTAAAQAALRAAQLAYAATGSLVEPAVKFAAQAFNQSHHWMIWQWELEMGQLLSLAFQGRYLAHFRAAPSSP